MPAVASTRFRYIGTPGSRIWRRLFPAAVLALALPAGGCSFSYQLGSLFNKDDPKPEVTGSIAATAAAPAAAQLPSDNDLAYARAAVAEVLSRGGKDASVPWRNPQSGARGNVTPLATSYSEAGMACRDFLASYIHGESQDWLEGAACRTTNGAWQVRRLKPLRSS